jgi:hypothetical protein
MLHVVYILAFTIVAFLALGNLIRSLISLSSDTQRYYPPANPNSPKNKSRFDRVNCANSSVSHPELLDKNGKIIEEPLLVMRSVSVEDARQQLDSIFKASPSKNADSDE